MSRPRFLADHDLTEAIHLGVVRREPSIEFHLLREVGIADRADSEVLDYAASHGLILVSHDVNTITAQCVRANRSWTIDAWCLSRPSRRSDQFDNRQFGHDLGCQRGRRMDQSGCLSSDTVRHIASGTVSDSSSNPRLNVPAYGVSLAIYQVGSTFFRA
ncbi:MAG: DUF5615 family PIN-like protein [Phycisphaerae bacterium]|nr:DUF5615 family PIN-like protein [Phycisphaerae bacterium]